MQRQGRAAIAAASLMRTVPPSLVSPCHSSQIVLNTRLAAAATYSTGGRGNSNSTNNHNIDNRGTNTNDNESRWSRHARDGMDINSSSTGSRRHVHPQQRRKERQHRDGSSQPPPRPSRARVQSALWRQAAAGDWRAALADIRNYNTSNHTKKKNVNRHGVAAVAVPPPPPHLPPPLPLWEELIAALLYHGHGEAAFAVWQQQQCSATAAAAAAGLSGPTVLALALYTAVADGMPAAARDLLLLMPQQQQQQSQQLSDDTPTEAAAATAPAASSVAAAAAYVRLLCRPAQEQPEDGSSNNSSSDAVVVSEWLLRVLQRQLDSAAAAAAAGGSVAPPQPLALAALLYLLLGRVMPDGCGDSLADCHANKGLNALATAVELVRLTGAARAVVKAGGGSGGGSSSSNSDDTNAATAALAAAEADWTAAVAAAAAVSSGCQQHQQRQGLVASLLAAPALLVAPGSSPLANSSGADGQQESYQLLWRALTECLDGSASLPLAPPPPCSSSGSTLFAGPTVASRLLLATGRPDLLSPPPPLPHHGGGNDDGSGNISSSSSSGSTADMCLLSPEAVAVLACLPLPLSLSLLEERNVAAAARCTVDAAFAIALGRCSSGGSGSAVGTATATTTNGPRPTHAFAALQVLSSALLTTTTSTSTTSASSLPLRCRPLARHPRAVEAVITRLTQIQDASSLLPLSSSQLSSGVAASEAATTGIPSTTTTASSSSPSPSSTAAAAAAAVVSQPVDLACREWRQFVVRLMEGVGTTSVVAVVIGVVAMGSSPVGIRADPEGLLRLSPRVMAGLHRSWWVPAALTLPAHMCRAYELELMLTTAQQQKQHPRREEELSHLSRDIILLCSQGDSIGSSSSSRATQLVYRWAWVLESLDQLLPRSGSLDNNTTNINTSTSYMTISGNITPLAAAECCVALAEAIAATLRRCSDFHRHDLAAELVEVLLRLPVPQSRRARRPASTSTTTSPAVVLTELIWAMHVTAAATATSTAAAAVVSSDRRATAAVRSLVTAVAQWQWGLLDSFPELGELCPPVVVAALLVGGRGGSGNENTTNSNSIRMNNKTRRRLRQQQRQQSGNNEGRGGPPSAKAVINTLIDAGQWQAALVRIPFTFTEPLHIIRKSLSACEAARPGPGAAWAGALAVWRYARKLQGGAEAAVKGINSRSHDGNNAALRLSPATTPSAAAGSFRLGLPEVGRVATLLAHGGRWAESLLLFGQLGDDQIDGYVFSQIAYALRNSNNVSNDIIDNKSNAADSRRTDLVVSLWARWRCRAGDAVPPSAAMVSALLAAGLHGTQGGAGQAACKLVKEAVMPSSSMSLSSPHDTKDSSSDRAGEEEVGRRCCCVAAVVPGAEVPLQLGCDQQAPNTNINTDRKRSAAERNERLVQRLLSEGWHESWQSALAVAVASGRPALVEIVARRSPLNATVYSQSSAALRRRSPGSPLAEQLAPAQRAVLARHLVSHRDDFFLSNASSQGEGEVLGGSGGSLSTAPVPLGVECKSGGTASSPTTTTATTTSSNSSCRGRAQAEIQTVERLLKDLIGD